MGGDRWSPRAYTQVKVLGQLMKEIIGANGSVVLPVGWGTTSSFPTSGFLFLSV